MHFSFHYVEVGSFGSGSFQLEKEGVIYERLHRLSVVFEVEVKVNESHTNAKGIQVPSALSFRNVTAVGFAFAELEIDVFEVVSVEIAPQSEVLVFQTHQLVYAIGTHHGLVKEAEGFVTALFKYEWPFLFDSGCGPVFESLIIEMDLISTVSSVPRVQLRADPYCDIEPDLFWQELSFLVKVTEKALFIDGGVDPIEQYVAPVHGIGS